MGGWHDSPMRAEVERKRSLWRIWEHLNAMSFAESAMARQAFGMPMPTGYTPTGDESVRRNIAAENQMAGRPYDASGRPQSRGVRAIALTTGELT